MRNTKPVQTLLSEADRLLDETGHHPTEKQFREGFLDDEGEPVWIVRRIVKYNPAKCEYLVDWKGFPKTSRTWLKSRLLGKAFTKQKKAAREAAKQN